MATHYRLLQGAANPVAADEKSDPSDVADAGGNRFIGVSVNVHVAGGGTGNTSIVIQHAAVNDDAYFIDTGISADLTATGVVYAGGTDDFLRYLRWKVQSDLTGTANVTVDVIAKEA